MKALFLSIPKCTFGVLANSGLLFAATPLHAADYPFQTIRIPDSASASARGINARGDIVVITGDSSFFSLVLRMADTPAWTLALKEQLRQDLWQLTTTE